MFFLVLITSYGFVAPEVRDMGSEIDFNRYFDSYTYRDTTSSTKKITAISEDGKNKIIIDQRKNVIKFNGRIVCEYGNGMKVSPEFNLPSKDRYPDRFFTCIYPPVFIDGAHGYVPITFAFDSVEGDELVTHDLKGNKYRIKIVDVVADLDSKVDSIKISQFEARLRLMKIKLKNTEESRDCFSKVTPKAMKEINEFVSCINREDYKCIGSYFSGKNGSSHFKEYSKHEDRYNVNSLKREDIDFSLFNSLSKDIKAKLKESYLTCKDMHFGSGVIIAQCQSDEEFKKEILVSNDYEFMFEKLLEPQYDILKENLFMKFYAKAITKSIKRIYSSFNKCTYNKLKKIITLKSTSPGGDSVGFTADMFVRLQGDKIISVSWK